jgi:hypothetical protein
MIYSNLPDVPLRGTFVIGATSSLLQKKPLPARFVAKSRRPYRLPPQVRGWHRELFEGVLVHLTRCWIATGIPMTLPPQAKQHHCRPEHCVENVL